MAGLRLPLSVWVVVCARAGLPGIQGFCQNFDLDDLE